MGGIELVFDANEVISLREKHVEILEGIGTIPTGMQQNKLLGAPFIRVNYEGCRAIVLKDLISRGFSVLDGLKFGADFAAYDGDPVAVHGFFLVKVVSNGLRGADLVMWNRLATSVLKKILLANVNDEGQVSYTKVERFAAPAEG